MAIASNVLIRYDGSVDITANVLYESASFEALMGARAGIFEIEVKDPDFTLDFVTGRTLELLVDGVVTYGGYLLGATRTYFFPVVDTSDLGTVTRKWKLRGADYNLLFEKRVLRNPSNYLNQIPNFAKTTMDGALIREALTASKYFDVPAGFDVTTEVDDVVPPFDPLNEGASGEGAWVQQGSTLRTFIEDLVQFSGAVYYFAPDKKLHHKALEDVESRWGFSDRPNKDVVTASPVEFQGATFGFRDGEVTSDGSHIVNDALIWGGSEWAGDGATVFGRETNAASITDHHRWQVGEVHFGEDGFKTQSGVDARANVIVNGDPGSVGGDPNRGLRFPQWQVSLSWFSRDVPRISGTPDHLKAGDLVTFVFYAFGADEMNPLVLTLPLRQVSMSFVALDETGDAHVKFTGSFGLQLDDPYTLWRYLLRTKARITSRVSVADGTNPAPYGSHFSGAPVEDPDGVATVFNLPSSYGYIGGTTEVYVGTDGAGALLMQRGVDYTESDPGEGQITFTNPPSGTSWIWIACRLL